MKYIEAPMKESIIWPSLFVAGGISNCPDWQKEFIEYFKDTSFNIINPRRYNFDLQDTDVEREQIIWEHEYLEISDHISFWFPKETLCPITLYELWKYANSAKSISIWVEKWYQRKRDIRIQMELLRPNLEIHYDLYSLSQEVRKTLHL